MKKLIVLAAAAAGVAYAVKFKPEQVKALGARITRDPRVQSALATAAVRTARGHSPLDSRVPVYFLRWPAPAPREPLYPNRQRKPP